MSQDLQKAQATLREFERRFQFETHLVRRAEDRIESYSRTAFPPFLGVLAQVCTTGQGIGWIVSWTMTGFGASLFLGIGLCVAGFCHGLVDRHHEGWAHLRVRWWRLWLRRPQRIPPVQDPYRGTESDKEIWHAIQKK